jgi:hypothetical protein
MQRAKVRHEEKMKLRREIYRLLVVVIVVVVIEYRS